MVPLCSFEDTAKDSILWFTFSKVSLIVETDQLETIPVTFCSKQVENAFGSLESNTLSPAILPNFIARSHAGRGTIEGLPSHLVHGKKDR